MAEKISQLTAATSANYSDLIETSQSDGMGGWLTKKATDYQLTQLIGSRDQIVTTSAVLANPCPNVVYVNFTTPGQTITLPPANGTNGHPAGKVIWFKVAPTNSQNFSILENDGTTFLTATGTTGNYNDYILAYSTNSNQNGTPIRLFVLLNNSAGYLPLSGGTLTGDLTISENKNSTAQVSVENANAGSSASAAFFVTTQGNADAIFGTIFNGGNLVLFGLRASDSKFVFSSSNNLASGVLGTIDQNGAWTFTDTLNTDRGLFGNFAAITGTTATLSATSHAFKMIPVTNASGCAITFNDNSASPGDWGAFQRISGAGNVTIVAGSGVTVNSDPYQSLVCAAPNGKIFWWKYATNQYYISGSLTP